MVVQGRLHLELTTAWVGSVFHSGHLAAFTAWKEHILEIWQ